MKHILFSIHCTKILFLLTTLAFISIGCSSEDNTSESSNIYTGLASSGMDILVYSSNPVVTGFAFGDVSTDSGSSEADVFLARHADADGSNISFDQAGSSSEDFAQAIAMDSSNNFYVTGYTYGDLSSDADPGSTDVFLMQFNLSGVWQWTKRYGTTGNDYCWDIVIDGTELFLVGNTEGVFPGSGVTNEHGNDIFLLKLDNSGNQVDVVQIGKDTAINSNVFSKSFGVTVAHDGTNVLIGGITNDIIGGSKLGGNDIIIASYLAADLNTQNWIRQLGTAYDDSITEMVVNGTDIYFTGFSYGTPDAAYDYSAAGYSEDHDYTEAFLYRYSGGGVQQWVEQFGSAYYDRGYGLAISGTNIYITGNTNDDLAADNEGSYDFFISKYEDDGTNLWHYQYGSDYYDTADGIVVDGTDIFITGRTYDELYSKSNDSAAFSAFVIKYNTTPDSNPDWAIVY